tara:strand:- start:2048 stop:2284 length:237 start_codon:yes stop_codon:yes gene_type:complete
MSDNVIKFPYKIKSTSKPVPMVCEMAAKTFEQIVIMGQNDQGQVQMITTFKDPADVLWCLEQARFGLMQGIEEDELYE